MAYTINEYTDGQIESVVYAYENDMLDIYQVEDMLDYICVDWNEFVAKLTVSEKTIEACQFMQHNGYNSVMDDYKDVGMSPKDFLSE